MSDIYKLLDQVSEMGNHPAEWWDKMVHKIPNVPSVDRAKHLLEAAKDKVVLDIGASGPMSEAVYRVAKEYHSIDKLPSDRPNHYIIDLDRLGYPESYTLDNWPDEVDAKPELIIAGELIEHLSNPGTFLDNIHSFGVPIILTTPNAGHNMYRGNREIVNKDHVSWYSYHTLLTLITRHNFHLREWFWYNGKPMVAEGLIFHLEPVYGKP